MRSSSACSFAGTRNPWSSARGSCPALHPSDPAARLELEVPTDFEVFELPIRWNEAAQTPEEESVLTDGRGELTRINFWPAVSGRLRAASGSWEPFRVDLDQDGAGTLLLAVDGAPYDLELMQPERRFLQLGPGDEVVVDGVR